MGNTHQAEDMTTMPANPDRSGHSVSSQAVSSSSKPLDQAHKRRRDQSPYDSAPTHGVRSDLAFSRPEKRPRQDHLNGERLKTLIVHRVCCSRAALGHSRHQQDELFLDHPSLFKNDNKASVLRGQRRIRGTLEQFLEGNQDIKLIVERTYDCISYHEMIKEHFIPLQLPAADMDMQAELRPYFSVLQDNAELAEAKTELIHTSRGLRDAMAKLLEAEPLLFAEWKASLSPPYLQIFHTRTQTRTLATTLLNDQLASYVLQLLDYVEESFGREYQEANTLFAQGLVKLKHLRKLFGPNEIIVTREDGEAVAYVSMLCPVPSASISGRRFITLKCYKWAFEGYFGKEEKDINVFWPAKNDGPISISDLRTYPLRFDATGQLEKSLRERGTVFWSCRKRRFMGYKPTTASFQIQVSNPRYMIDMTTYLELHPKQETQVAVLRDDLGERMSSDIPPEDPFVLLLPPKIKGYGLHDKKWRDLLVRQLRPVRWNKKAFEQLVLDHQKKELIEAMVRIHLSSNMSTDIIEGKGNGLIILLHGGPGTGKTLTAESIAELAEKPLYRVTCGDIGTDPESVERYLESVLYIGSIWKAVVLLDESDVFLEEREKTDLQRNALVSVFLRVLEYYEGILILTSNRVGIFDEAFKSRVQLALHYPPLDYNGRWGIWNNLIRQLQKGQDGSIDDYDGTPKLVDSERINADELRDKIDVLAKEGLNGRQIRNAITTARQLARFREKPLGYAHLDQTIRVANEFEEYVEKTHGHNAGEYVRAAGMRFE